MTVCRGIAWILLAVTFLTAVPAFGAPRKFQDRALLSPNKEFAANIEWENLGFMGLLRMKIYDGQGRFLRMAEVPEIDPEPANLLWLDTEWVASESFLGEKAGGFFYVHAPSARGYLLEIVEPKPNAKWIFTVGTNDQQGTAPISNISMGRVSLFPIQLRKVPESEVQFFDVDFAKTFALAVDSYNDFRKKNNIRQIEILSEANIRSDLGAIFVANIDSKPEIIYFPVGAATPQEMLTRVRRQVLPTTVNELLARPGAPNLSVRWIENGEYVLEALAEDSQSTSGATILLRSKFEGVSDKPYSEAEPVASGAKVEDAKPADGKKKTPDKEEKKPVESKSTKKPAKSDAEDDKDSDSKSKSTPKSTMKQSEKPRTRLDVKKVPD